MWHIWEVNFLNFDVYQTVTGLVLVLILAALLRYTRLGRQIKATRVNPDLATIIGINANTDLPDLFRHRHLLRRRRGVLVRRQFTVEPAWANGR